MKKQPLSAIRIAKKLVCILMFVLAFDSVRGTDVFEGLSFEQSVTRHPHSLKITPRGLAFYHNKLYVGAGIGLLEIRDGTINRVYTWDKESTSAEFPAYDCADDLLWIQLPGLGKLAFYDGKTWRTVSRPRPKHGYIPNGMALEGFRFVSGRTNFFFQGGGRAWQWKDSRWIEEYAPILGNPKNPIGLVKTILPTDGCLYFLMRDEKDPDMTMARLGFINEKNKGETVFYQADGHWNLVTNYAAKFFSVDGAATSHKGYIVTKEGDLLEVTKSSVTKLSTPGKCEAIAISATGILVADFQDDGLYELKDRWSKVLGVSPVDGQGNYEIHLALTDKIIGRTVEPGYASEVQSAIMTSETNLWQQISLKP